MWAMSDIQENKQYRLQLCETSNGERFFRLVGAQSSDKDAASVVFTTKIVPTKLLQKRDLILISETVVLESGQRFFVDAHGIWMTEDEVSDLNAGVGLSAVRWVRGRMPRFVSR